VADLSGVPVHSLQKLHKLQRDRMQNRIPLLLIARRGLPEMSHFTAEIKECCAGPPQGGSAFAKKANFDKVVFVNLLAMQRDAL
jgi:hypothetical protein